MIGCVLAIRDLRRPVEDIPAADEDDLDDEDEDENDDDPYPYGYAGDEEDLLQHLDAAPPATAGPAGRAPTSPTPAPDARRRHASRCAAAPRPTASTHRRRAGVVVSRVRRCPEPSGLRSARWRDEPPTGGSDGGRQQVQDR